MPEKKPLLIFPEPAEVEKQKRHGGPSGLHLPPGMRQSQRLAPKFDQLRASWQAETTHVQATPGGIEPEMAVVMETVGSIGDFRKAVERIEGLDWLMEWDEEDIAGDEDFFDEDHPDKTLSGRLYLIMTNQKGIDQLLRLWQIYCQDENAKFPWGQTRLREVFKHLRDIRRWGMKDRLEETGVREYWQQFVQHEGAVVCEAELWFRSTPQRRALAYQNLRRVVHDVGGQCLSQRDIPDIGYHGVLIRVPANEIQQILANVETNLVCLNDVFFFRPAGQMASPVPTENATEEGPARKGGKPKGTPVVALLDGMPLANHPLLAGRIVVDDPDGWEGTYPSAQRWHGTQMASLIVHGELDGNGPVLPRPIYVRPVMRPNPYGWVDPPEECIPHDALPVDLMYRAVLRIVEGEGTEGPAAPDVRIVNLSICDGARPFLQTMSPFARLLDWLAWKYNLLFVVSAGNHAENIILDLPRADLAALDRNQIQDAVLKALAADMRNRKILAPAEAVNVLTVGAVHIDQSQPLPGDRRIDPYVDAVPATYSALGHGFRRAVKPDILLPGGRLFLMERMGNAQTNATLETPGSQLIGPPGQLAACPGRGSRPTNNCAYTRGTSNSASLASRCAAFLYDRLVELRAEPNGALLDECFMAVLLRALLVHGARWGDTYNVLEQSLRTPENRARFTEYVARFLGYGVVEPDRLMACTEQRATVLGVGTLCNAPQKLDRWLS
ncbi:MAG: S8 family peptidase [Planctomycetota bacterium]|nr:S8 family peptidase [Planctomycetota bacterium]